jgi:hypothetical protein
MTVSIFGDQVDLGNRYACIEKLAEVIAGLSDQIAGGRTISTVKGDNARSIERMVDAIGSSLTERTNLIESVISLASGNCDAKRAMKILSESTNILVRLSSDGHVPNPFALLRACEG